MEYLRLDPTEPDLGLEVVRAPSEGVTPELVRERDLRDSRLAEEGLVTSVQWPVLPMADEPEELASGSDRNSVSEHCAISDVAGGVRMDPLDLSLGSFIFFRVSENRKWPLGLSGAIRC